MVSRPPAFSSRPLTIFLMRGCWTWAIDELTKEKTGMTFPTAQMNADLLTDDLKKKRSSNQSFWLVGRPDVDIRQIKSGSDKGKYQAEVLRSDKSLR